MNGVFAIARCDSGSIGHRAKAVAEHAWLRSPNRILLRRSVLAHLAAVWYTRERHFLRVSEWYFFRMRTTRPRSAEKSAATSIGLKALSSWFTVRLLWIKCERPRQSVDHVFYLNRSVRSFRKALVNNSNVRAASRFTCHDDAIYVLAESALRGTFSCLQRTWLKIYKCHRNLA